MFNNIGGKIKAYATVVAWIGIIVSLISGIFLLGSGGDEILGFVCMIVGSLVSWLGSFIAYGFGQLIENTDKLVFMMNNGTTVEMNAVPDDKSSILDAWRREGLITEEEYNQKMESLK